MDSNMLDLIVIPGPFASQVWEGVGGEMAGQMPIVSNKDKQVSFILELRSLCVLLLQPPGSL